MLIKWPKIQITSKFLWYMFFYAYICYNIFFCITSQLAVSLLSFCTAFSPLTGKTNWLNLTYVYSLQCSLNGQKFWKNEKLLSFASMDNKKHIFAIMFIIAAIKWKNPSILNESFYMFPSNINLLKIVIIIFCFIYDQD